MIELLFKFFMQHLFFIKHLKFITIFDCCHNEASARFEQILSFPNSKHASLAKLYKPTLFKSMSQITNDDCQEKHTEIILPAPRKQRQAMDNPAFENVSIKQSNKTNSYFTSISGCW